MRKINVENYQIQMGIHPETLQPVVKNYMVKESLIGVLFMPKPGEKGLGAVEALRRDMIGQAILKATTEVALEESEYTVLKSAFEEAGNVFDQAAVELVKRVLEAPKVDLSS